MAEIDLVPGEYRRLLVLEQRLKRFGWIYGALLLGLALAYGGLQQGLHDMQGQLAALDTARQAERTQKLELQTLRTQEQAAMQQLRILDGLRGGIAARDMFAVIDRAWQDGIWFRDWKFRRAGEVVEDGRKAVQTGYFLVVPLDGEGSDGEKAWLMETHMEIQGRALDHGALARFVAELVDQQEIQEARILSTHTRSYSTREVVDFELAVVVRTAT